MGLLHFTLGSCRKGRIKNQGEKGGERGRDQGEKREEKDQTLHMHCEHYST